jgi:chorismate-pyruvate lyase
MLQPSISERERRLYLNLLERILRSQGNVTKSMKIERLEVEVESLKQIMGGDKV